MNAMFGGSQGMPLFRVAGINVTANWSWLLALAYVVVVLSGDYESMLGDGEQAQAYIWAVGVSFLFFGSIILHEFGHAIVARRNGIGILGIELWLLGGLAKMDRDPKTPGVEFRVAAAGPLVTFLVSAVCLGAAFAINADQASHLVTFQSEAGDDALLASVVWLGLVNAFLLVFNLIPAYPLDGGRIARATAWRLTGSRERATTFAATLGGAFGYLLIFVGVLLISRVPISGVIFIFMGWSLAQSARGARIERNLLGEASSLTVEDVMDRQPVAIGDQISVDRALDEFFWRYKWPWFPVVDTAGRFVGLVEQHAVDLVDEGDRTSRFIGELVAPDSGRARSVPVDTPLTAVLANEGMRDYGALVAIDDQGVMRGVITIEQVQRGLRDAIARATRTTAPASE
ncbi:MAG: site-2 protease family protein [Solirubrobacterales bacterium]